MSQVPQDQILDAIEHFRSRMIYALQDHDCQLHQQAVDIITILAPLASLESMMDEIALMLATSVTSGNDEQIQHVLYTLNQICGTQFPTEIKDEDS